MRYGFIHTTLGLENTSEQLIDDSNNISTRKAFQQNKESINTIHDKIDKENVTDLTHLDNSKHNQSSTSQDLLITSILHCPRCEIGPLARDVHDASTSSFSDPGQRIL